MNPFAEIGQVEGINTNGSVMVGRGHLANWRDAYLFTSWDGHIEDLGALRRGLTPNEQDLEDASIALAVSDDSSAVGI